MFKYTPTTLKKLEQIFKESNYVVRYEKGTFNSGYCILEDKQVVVINKFFTLEARINALLDILQQREINTGQLTDATARDYRNFMEKAKER